jgi:ribulose-5-phosphate 4-epimerase/fuculose-1-phosphate aldolase
MPVPRHDPAARRSTDLSSLSVRGALAAPVVPARPVREVVSDAEWQMRVDLAACYRLTAVYGMTDMIYNHITARVPGEPQHFLINPYGYQYSEITASLLHKVDHHGEIVLRADTPYGINHAGYVIHSAVHQARPDVHCVMHSHTRAGVAVAAMKCGLLPISLTAMRFHGHMGYHDFQGTVVDLSEQASLVADLADHHAMILRNHGLLTCGPTVAEAFNAHYVLDLACRIQIDAMASGAELLVPEPSLLQETATLFKPEVRRPYGLLEWESLLRQLDRIDPSFRD